MFVLIYLQSNLSSRSDDSFVMNWKVLPARHPVPKFAISDLQIPMNIFVGVHFDVYLLNQRKCPKVNGRSEEVHVQLYLGTVVPPDL